MKTAIEAIRAREILDSRGRPTVEADVVLAGGARGRASVPSGASTGASEAHELRDGDRSRYGGLGVSRAVANANGEIAGALRGLDALAQSDIDRRMRELDGTPQLGRLGANATLAVSLAAARAAAAASGLEFFQHIAALAGTAGTVLPLPMVNIFSGGMHAAGGMDFQDFLAMPLAAQGIEEAVHMSARVRTAATEVCRDQGLPTLLADEGGVSAGEQSPRGALLMMVQAIERAGLRPGVDVGIAIDVAASTLGDAGLGYRLARAGRSFASAEMVDLLDELAREFPIVSIEDGLGEEDWGGWSALTQRLGGRVQLVGDDLFATHPARLGRGVREGVANGVLVKANQNGTLTGTLEVIAQAKAAGYATIVSARSGETEDAFMSDLAVGTAAGQIKIGSLRTSNTVAKYNQLLRIAAGTSMPFAGAAALAGRRVR